MKLIDYLNEISENGTKVRLPLEGFSTMESGSKTEDGMFTKVTLYKTDFAVEKEQRKDLIKVTLATLNCEDFNHWWKYLSKLFPKYDSNDSEGNADLYDTLLTSLSIKLSEIAIVERHSRSSIMMKALTTRINTWKANVEASVEGKSVTICIEGA